MLIIQWLISYLIVVCGKVFAALFSLFPKVNNPMDRLGLARHEGKLYPYHRIRGNNIFLMDIVDRKGFATKVVSLNEVEIVRHPKT